MGEQVCQEMLDAGVLRAREERLEKRERGGVCALGDLWHSGVTVVNQNVPYTSKQLEEKILNVLSTKE